jgi:cellulose synthase (UDP-forming)
MLGFLTSLNFFYWWINNFEPQNPVYILAFIIVLFYIIVQIYFLWIIFLNAKYPSIIKPDKIFKVDVFLPTYNEPTDLVEKTLKAVTEIKYPHTTYLIDDGNKIAYKELAEKYNVNYIARGNNDKHKAGNINNVLKHSKGEIIAVFDIDHIPQEDYLDFVVGHFTNPKVGFVQVALDHYNYSESYVARACCMMSDDFFAATMLGMSEMNSAVIFGSNSIFRREALLSIGGYQPGLAEDLHTSIKLHAAGWQSRYVAKILAKGLVPADLAAFFKQQFKWANGVFEVLFKHFPSLIKSLTINQIICYSTRMTYYLAGPIVFAHIVLVIYALFSRTLNLKLVDYIIYSIPFITVFFLIQVYIKIFYYIKEKKKGFHVSGYLLVLGTWPVYVTAFLSALFRIKIPFIATPKELTSKGLITMIIPQLLTVGILIVGIVYKINNYNDTSSLIIILFASILILLHYVIFYGVWENYEHTKKMNDKKYLKEATKLF